MARAKKNPTAPPPIGATRARGIAARLLEWYDANKRDLPWRRTADPYAILVSEFMLQQTQVATVIPYYHRFLDTFPTIEALARSPEQEVLRLWAGLGYYSRARHLHAAARRIVDQYQGQVPRDPADLLFLPGVGRYVAGAVASIAYRRPVAAVDANAVRVLCRLFALALNPAAPRERRELEELAARLVPLDRPGDFNQAIMELGARICAPREPRCPECPLNRFCQARKQGDPHAYPPKAKRPATVQVEEACAIVRRGSRYLVAKRPQASGRYRNMWEFPHTELTQGDDPKKRLKAYLNETYGLSVQVEEEWAEIRHQVTHHKIRKRVFLCTPTDRQRQDSATRAAGAKVDSGMDAPARQRTEDPEARWATLDEIDALPLGAPHKRIAALLAERQTLWRE